LDHKSYTTCPSERPEGIMRNLKSQDREATKVYLNLCSVETLANCHDDQLQVRLTKI